MVATAPFDFIYIPIGFDYAKMIQYLPKAAKNGKRKMGNEMHGIVRHVSCGNGGIRDKNGRVAGLGDRSGRGACVATVAERTI